MTTDITIIKKYLDCDWSTETKIKEFKLPKTLYTPNISIAQEKFSDKIFFTLEKEDYKLLMPFYEKSAIHDQDTEKWFGMINNNTNELLLYCMNPNSNLQRDIKRDSKNPLYNKHVNQDRYVLPPTNINQFFSINLTKTKKKSRLLEPNEVIDFCKRYIDNIPKNEITDTDKLSYLDQIYNQFITNLNKTLLEIKKEPEQSTLF